MRRQVGAEWYWLAESGDFAGNSVSGAESRFQRRPGFVSYQILGRCDESTELHGHPQEEGIGRMSPRGIIGRSEPCRKTCPGFLTAECPGKSAAPRLRGKRVVFQRVVCWDRRRTFAISRRANTNYLSPWLVPARLLASSPGPLRRVVPRDRHLTADSYEGFNLYGQTRHQAILADRKQRPEIFCERTADPSTSSTTAGSPRLPCSTGAPALTSPPAGAIPR